MSEANGWVFVCGEVFDRSEVTAETRLVSEANGVKRTARKEGDSNPR